jgi:hypothetical protein
VQAYKKASLWLVKACKTGIVLTVCLSQSSHVIRFLLDVVVPPYTYGIVGQTTSVQAIALHELSQVITTTSSLVIFMVVGMGHSGKRLIFYVVRLVSILAF